MLIDPKGNIFLTINVGETYWSTSSTVLRKYSTSFDMPPPSLSIAPYTYDPVTATLSLSGERSSGAARLCPISVLLITPT
jgi:hypothetical protein